MGPRVAQRGIYKLSLPWHRGRLIQVNVELNDAMYQSETSLRMNLRSHQGKRNFFLRGTRHRGAIKKRPARRNNPFLCTQQQWWERCRMDWACTWSNPRKCNPPWDTCFGINRTHVRFDLRHETPEKQESVSERPFEDIQGNVFILFA